MLIHGRSQSTFTVLPFTGPKYPSKLSLRSSKQSRVCSPPRNVPHPHRQQHSLPATEQTLLGGMGFSRSTKPRFYIFSCLYFRIKIVEVLSDLELCKCKRVGARWERKALWKNQG